MNTDDRNLNAGSLDDLPISSDPVIEDKCAGKKVTIKTKKAERKAEISQSSSSAFEMSNAFQIVATFMSNELIQQNIDREKDRRAKKTKHTQSMLAFKLKKAEILLKARQMGVDTEGFFF